MPDRLLEVVDRMKGAATRTLASLNNLNSLRGNNTVSKEVGVIVIIVLTVAVAKVQIVTKTRIRISIRIGQIIVLETAINLMPVLKPLVDPVMDLGPGPLHQPLLGPGPRKDPRVPDLARIGEPGTRTRAPPPSPLPCSAKKVMYLITLILFSL